MLSTGNQRWYNQTEAWEHAEYESQITLSFFHSCKQLAYQYKVPSGTFHHVNRLSHSLGMMWESSEKQIIWNNCASPGLGSNKKIKFEEGKVLS